MSEKHRPSTHEKQHSPEHAHVEHVKHHVEKQHTKVELKHEHRANIENIQAKIEQEAISGKEHARSEKEAAAPQPEPNFIPDKFMQKHAFDRTIQHVRKHLSPQEKRFSKVMHQPMVDKVSDVAAKTVARPIGITTGAICMLLGSVLLLWASKRYGFSYNYLIGLLLLVFGYVVGCILELGYLLIRRQRSE